MQTLQTKYAGLTLRNPIIIGSSGLTNTVDKIKELERAGAGAVVLKSLFEEQILMQSEHLLKEAESYPEAYDYVREYVKSNDIKSYIDLISDAKKYTSIPIIASINCYEKGSWADFAQRIEIAGADAIEINILKISTDIEEKPGEYEQLHIDILKEVKSKVKIPVTLKLYYNANQV